MEIPLVNLNRKIIISLITKEEEVESSIDNQEPGEEPLGTDTPEGSEKEMKENRTIKSMKEKWPKKKSQ